jgi:hypothetical protein
LINSHDKLKYLSNAEITNLIENYIRRKDYRQIMKDRITNGYTYDQLSARYGFSAKQVKNIVKNCENDLCKIIEKKLH